MDAHYCKRARFAVRHAPSHGAGRNVAVAGRAPTAVMRYPTVRSYPHRSAPRSRRLGAVRRWIDLCGSPPCETRPVTGHSVSPHARLRRLRPQTVLGIDGNRGRRRPHGTDVMRYLTVRTYPNRSAARSRRSGAATDRVICARPAACEPRSYRAIGARRQDSSALGGTSTDRSFGHVPAAARDHVLAIARTCDRRLCDALDRMLRSVSGRVNVDV